MSNEINKLKARSGEIKLEDEIEYYKQIETLKALRDSLRLNLN